MYEGQSPCAVAVEPAETQTPASLFFATEEEFTARCEEDTKADCHDGQVIFKSPQSTLISGQETWFATLFDLSASQNGLGWEFAVGNVQVRLRPGLRRNPDAIFVEKSRSHLIHETHLEGAPDVLAGLVSPASTLHDWHEK